eukprot:14230768-Alexandrium_andersonii.AAC.1
MCKPPRMHHCLSYAYLIVPHTHPDVVCSFRWLASRFAYAFAGFWLLERVNRTGDCFGIKACVAVKAKVDAKGCKHLQAYCEKLRIFGKSFEAVAAVVGAIQDRFGIL